MHYGMYYMERKTNKKKPWLQEEVRRNVKVYEWGDEYWAVHSDGPPREVKLGKLLSKVGDQVWVFQHGTLRRSGDDDVTMAEWEAIKHVAEESV